MGMPAFKAAGTFTAGTGDITPPYPTGGSAPAANDIAILLIETEEHETVTSANWQGFAAVTGSPQSNVTSDTKLYVYWKRCAGSDTAPLLVDPGNHCCAQILLFDGVKTTGDPWNVASAGVSAASSTATATGATTTADNCLVLIAVGTTENSTGTAGFTGWANADLTSIVERADAYNTAGTGGGFGLAEGQKASAGAYGNTTVTVIEAGAHPFLTLALEGAAAVNAAPTTTSVAGTATVPTPTVAAHINAAPTTTSVTADATIPTPAVATVNIADITTTSASATATLPTPTIDAQRVVEVTTTSVEATATVPTATVEIGEPPVSASVSFLAVPQNLVATTVSSSQIDLDWDVVSGAATYSVMRDGVVVETGIDTNSWSDTGLDPSTNYHYRVKGVAA